MDTRKATLRSLAKINLDLRVLHQRADGYHELRTVFQTISLADTIEVEYQASRRTHLGIEDPLAIPDNLILRAARAVLDQARRTARVHFRLTKRIPMGGGLGGGSSNAAAVLLGLPVLAGCRIPRERLHEIALNLGSDVPFFLQGGTALGLGRGEELYPLPDLKREPILLVAPAGVHVSTASAYQALGRGLTLPESSRYISNFRLLVEALVDGRSAGAASALSANDFEPVVFQEFPPIEELMGKLSKLGVGARMTGSGSAVFAIFESVVARARARKKLDFKTLPASLVARAGYRRMWRKQLREHLNGNEKVWPPQSRYAR
jgi:4-diphosphocytidyl-2-C-methyl-D-erythritol kinase